MFACTLYCVSQLPSPSHSCLLRLTAAFTVSLELQGGNCSDQLTLICRHSDDGSAPLWIHNGTVESSDVFGTAFPGAVYTVQARTEHTTIITGIDKVRALDGHVIQCVYDDLGTLIKSSAVKYSFIPPGQCMYCNMHLSWSWPCSSLVDTVVVGVR